MKNNDADQTWKIIFETLNESQKRWFSAQRAQEIGYGGISHISKLTKLSRTTITQGIKELSKGIDVDNTRIRICGGGRHQSVKVNEELATAITRILEETTAGDPMNMLRWTSKSTRNIAECLRKKDFNITHETVRKILKAEGYSLQSNKKTLSGRNHPDRDAQFQHINETVKDFIRKGNPVISVDTKKKELVGKFKNNGATWRKEGQPIEVNDHDFRSQAKGLAVPYGAYDVQRDEGFVNVGMSADTAEFAVSSIWQWWRYFGRKNYAACDGLLICADGGGSNSSRSRAWKFYLQDLANKLDMPVSVCHYPPGTSKWNKIEHKMFSFISLNWKGKPLENFESIVKLISGTSTRQGLRIKAKLDKNTYEKGQKISGDEFSKIRLQFSEKFPLWNYKIEAFE